MMAAVTPTGNGLSMFVRMVSYDQPINYLLPLKSILEALGIFNTLSNWLNRQIHNGPPKEVPSPRIPPIGSLDSFISWLPICLSLRIC